MIGPRHAFALAQYLSNPNPVTAGAGTGKPNLFGVVPQAISPGQRGYFASTQGGPTVAGSLSPFGSGMGDKGPVAGSNADVAAAFAGRNVAVSPNLAGSLMMGTNFAGPLGMLGLIGQLGMSQFGYGNNPFNPPGAMFSTAQQAALANALAGVSQNAPAVTKLNAMNSLLGGMRSQAGGFGGGGSYGGGSLGSGPGAMGAGGNPSGPPGSW